MVQPGGRIELSSSALPEGAGAEVHVFLREAPTTAEARLEAMKRLQDSMRLTPEAARKWMSDAKAERQIWGNKD